jgi:iron(II)-dependent oxidoreductase
MLRDETTTREAAESVAAAAPPAAVLAAWVRDARDRTFDLVEGLSGEQLFGPRLAIVNPLLWEIGHVAWFQEKWVLRHAGKRAPIRADGDALYDSTAIPHDTRWDLPLPSRAETYAYMREVRDRVLERVESGALGPDETYFVLLSVFHEDMHDEAFTFTRQTLGLPPPPHVAGAQARRLPRSGAASRESDGGAAAKPGDAIAAAAKAASLGDAAIPGGRFRLGALPGTEPFVFDNEKWAHEVEVGPFRIACAATTEGDYAAFVDDGGYRRRKLWSETGWRWRVSARAEHPAYWRRSSSTANAVAERWERRRFDLWSPLEPTSPVLHVNWFEAEAYCRWARRRLPTEAEWEAAAACGPAHDGRGLASGKRRFPWGDESPSPERANLDASAGGPIDVTALPAGDGAFGCRQMIGNVWEWCSSDFVPYPGFVADPYREYSEPWFGSHKVLRGGCWATRGRLIRATWRNFYMPDRRDVGAGIRTCALED